MTGNGGGEGDGTGGSVVRAGDSLTGDSLTGAGADRRWRAAHRAVLDHLLRLVARSPLGDALVLRGSMVMPAWVGAAAREPADLDWIVPRPLLVPVDLRDPYPYVAELAVVQQWPEAADGAGRYEIWEFEEFDTRGLHPVVPPEGLRWVPEAEVEDRPPHKVLLDLVETDPRAAPDVLLDPKSARSDGTWGYAYDENTEGLRLIVPWRARGLPPGEARLDFALDEWLPEPPVLTAIPRGDGTGPTVVRTASRELSLAWKLLWLHADSATEGRARAKDLYDAVVLAEDDATRLTPRLLNRVFRGERGRVPDTVTAPGPAAADGPAVTTPADLAHPDLPHPADPCPHGPHPHGPRPDDLDHLAALDDLRLHTVTLDPADWESFRAGHPAVRGTPAEWLRRLRRALIPRTHCADKAP